MPLVERSDNVCGCRSCRSSAADPRACPARCGSTITGCARSSSSGRPHWAAWRGEAPIPTSGCSGDRAKPRARMRRRLRATSAKRRSRPGSAPGRSGSGARADGRFALDDRACPSRGRCNHCRRRLVVIATGTRFRGEEWLDQVENARQLAARGRVHLGPTWAGEPGADLGSHVAVIGGGDNAFDVSRMLAREGRASDGGHALDGAAGAAAAGRAAARARSDPEWREMTGGAHGRGAGRSRRADSAAIERRRGDRGRSCRLLFGYRPNTSEPWLAELALATGRAVAISWSTATWKHRSRVFAVGESSNPVASLHRHRDRRRHHGGARDSEALWRVTAELLWLRTCVGAANAEDPREAPALAVDRSTRKRTLAHRTGTARGLPAQRIRECARKAVA